MAAQAAPGPPGLVQVGLQPRWGWGQKAVALVAIMELLTGASGPLQAEVVPEPPQAAPVARMGRSDRTWQHSSCPAQEQPCFVRGGHIAGC